MMKYLYPFLASTALFLLPTIASAQTYQPTNRAPVADSTLGTQVSGNGNNFSITGGVNKGQTLFHSFTDFSVPTNGQANFTNPVGNRDIITRVTGSVFSDINGVVNTNGANFFLINPNGIVFGTNAQLNVGKAFVGSTANSLDLVDAGGRTITFGTNPNGDAPLLSVAPNVLFDVSRLNMGGGTGAISNFGTLQTTNESQYIGLIGGNVKLDGGQIKAPGGRIELGGLTAPGAVGLGVEGNDLRVQFPTSVARGDVSLTNQARISVAGAGGGDIAISAQNVEILGASVVRGGIETGLGTLDSVAGDIKLNASGAIVISGADSAIANNVRANSKGKGGNITIDTNSLLLQDGASLQVSTLGQGNAGNVDVKVTGAMNVRGDGIASPSGITSVVTKAGVGAAGNIKIEAASLSLQDKGFFSSSSLGKGNAGNVDVKVIGSVDIAGTTSFVSSSIGPGAIGNGGYISINAGSLSLRDGAVLIASTFGQGNAGNVIVTAKDAVSLDRVNISSKVDKGSVGKGGSITIDAAALSIKNGSQISASTRGTSATEPAGRGDAGNINVKVAGAIDISGKEDEFSSGISSRVEIGSIGNGGNITVDAGSISLRDGAGLSTTMSGQGNAGNIDVKVSGVVDLKDLSTFTSFVSTEAIGNGGNITVNAGSVSLNSSQFAVSTLGQGNAGNVTITTKGNVSVDDSSILSAVGRGGVGKGGDITINAASLFLKNGSQLQSLISKASVDQPAGKGDAGNINVKVSGIVDISGLYGGILSSVSQGTEGNGGNITVDTGSLSLRDGSVLSAVTTGQGNAGTIAVNATDFINISGKSGMPAVVSVNSASETGVAGDIIIASPKITLNNAAGILAGSRSGNGGNISIGGKLPAGSTFNPNSKIDLTNFTATDLLILRRGAVISTAADGTAQQGGNGGNININSKLIVAIPTENSDISANAVKGRGGNVNINSQGLFGIQYRSQPTNNSDITASSEFGQSGTVKIATPGTDPGRDTTELPNATTDASNQISQVCSTNNRQNKLIVTGRGGLAPNANDPLTSDVVWQDPRVASSQPAASSATIHPVKIAPPAVGWVFDGKGKVTLIAAGTQGQPTTGTSVVCPNNHK